MPRLRGLSENLALVVAGVGGTAGYLTGNLDLAVFGGVVGFFLGQSIRSTVRTFTVDESR